MGDAEKVRENRLRRMAARRGFRLEKSRRRDSYALDYGRWYVIQADRNFLVAECDSLDQVEAALETGGEPRQHGWVKAGLPETQRAAPCAVCHHRFDDHGAAPEQKKLLVCKFPECECGCFRFIQVPSAAR